METWIPFFQSLIWPILIVVAVAIAKDRVAEFLDAVIARVKRGDPFHAGPFEMGAPVPQDAYSPHDQDAVGAKIKTSRSSAGSKFSSGAYPEMPEEVRKARVVHLTHSLGPWGKDRDGYTRRDVAVNLETIPASLLDIITSVTYYLPDTWPQELRVQQKRDRSSCFELKTRAYGEVTVGAVVEFSDETEPLVLNRYCNFYD